MRNIRRLLRIACICFAAPNANAQSVPTPPIKPLAWKAISTSKEHRTVEAIFWSDQRFVALIREWRHGKPLGLVGQSESGHEWNFSSPVGAPSTEIFASAQNDATLIVVPWNRISFQISAKDGTWSTVQSPANKIDGEQAMIFALIYGDREFIAVGQNGLILASSDARSWSIRRRAENRQPNLHSVAWNGKVYVAPYDHDRVLLSGNGRDWKVARAPGAPEKGQIVWLGKKFRVINTESQLYESEDGLSWSNKSIDLGCGPQGSLADIRKMVAINDTWIVLGRCMEKRNPTESMLWPKGLFALSHDLGVSWAHVAAGYFVRDIAASPGSNRFVAVGRKRVPGASDFNEEVFVVSQ